MRNAMPSDGSKFKESAVVNLDGPGSHWIAYRKNGEDVTYFDSFGNLKPLKDLINYLGLDVVK